MKALLTTKFVVEVLAGLALLLNRYSERPRNYRRGDGPAALAVITLNPTGDSSREQDDSSETSESDSGSSLRCSSTTFLL